MNMIPLVLVLIAILTTISHSILTQAKGTYHSKEIALGYIRAKRLYASSAHYQLYKSAPRAPKHFKEPAKNSLEAKQTSRSNELCKISIRTLSIKEKEKILMPVFQHILLTIYGYHESFHDLHIPGVVEKLTQHFADVIREKKNHELLTIQDLSPTDPQLYSLFYKMVRGTHHYTPQESGYPCFEELFSLDFRTGNKLASFGKIPPWLLSSFFDHNVAKTILEQEHHHSLDKTRTYIPLSHEECSTLIHQKHPTEKRFFELLELLDFRKNTIEKKKISAEDLSTHIVIKQP